MSNTARNKTDQELERIEKELIRIYNRAEKELGEKADNYFKRFAEKDEAKKKLLEAGKITEKEYKDWRIGQIMTGQHWTDMREQMAERLTKADKEAMAYLNGKLPDVYSINYNEVASGISDQLKGYSFELVDAHTVKNIAKSDETLLPYKIVDGQKAERWHTKTVNAEVMQGILQGESIPHLAKRLETNVGMKAAGSAVRNARTTVTSAENKGRMDMLHYAQEKGVRCHKIWLSSNEPGRTRDAHMPDDFKSLEVEVDEPFENSLGEIMYPGDPNADPANVYNCRCTMIYKVVGFGENMIESDEVGEQEQEAVANSIHLPESMFKKKQSETLEKYLDGIDGRDPDVAELYGTISDVASDKNYGIKVSYTESGHQVETRRYISTGEISDISVKIPKMDGDLLDQSETTIHEIGHLLDQLHGGSKSVSGLNDELKDAIANGHPISESTMSLFEKLKDNGVKAYDLAMEPIRAKNAEYNAKISELWKSNDWSAIKQLQKERDKAWKQGTMAALNAKRSAHEGYGALEDIYDAIMGGQLYGKGFFGHGSRYYSSASSRASETFANYCSLSQVNPDGFAILKAEQPEIFEACSKMVSKMLGR